MFLGIEGLPGGLGSSGKLPHSFGQPFPLGLLQRVFKKLGEYFSLLNIAGESEVKDSRKGERKVGRREEAPYVKHGQRDKPSGTGLLFLSSWDSTLGFVFCMQGSYSLV